MCMCFSRFKDGGVFPFPPVLPFERRLAHCGCPPRHEQVPGDKDRADKDYETCLGKMVAILAGSYSLENSFNGRMQLSTSARLSVSSSMTQVLV
jgi:hypothetical protein